MRGPPKASGASQARWDKPLPAGAAHSRHRICGHLCPPGPRRLPPAVCSHAGPADRADGPAAGLAGASAWRGCRPPGQGRAVHPRVDWLIAAPLALAAATQVWVARRASGARAAGSAYCAGNGRRASGGDSAAAVPQLGPATASALLVVPIYVAFAILAPLLGWMVARFFKLEAAAGRAVAFSASTRNSLVVLPLALAVPGAVPILPAVIVTQTLVELLSEMVYVRTMPRLGQSREVTHT